MALEELHHCVVCLDGEEGGDFYHSRCGHANVYLPVFDLVITPVRYADNLLEISV